MRGGCNFNTGFAIDDLLPNHLEFTALKLLGDVAGYSLFRPGLDLVSITGVTLQRQKSSRRLNLFLPITQSYKRISLVLQDASLFPIK